MAGKPGRSGGHNKLPFHVHALRGTRPRTTAPRIARPVDLAPATKPTTLSPGASRVWDTLAPIAIDIGTLTVADAGAFATLCELEATRAHASAMKGDTFAADAVRLERDTATALRGYYVLFGLDPVSRARLTAPDAAKPVSKWAGLLS